MRPRSECFLNTCQVEFKMWSQTPSETSPAWRHLSLPPSDPALMNANIRELIARELRATSSPSSGNGNQTSSILYLDRHPLHLLPGYSTESHELFTR